MTMCRRIAMVLCSLALTVLPAMALQPPTEPQEGFVSIDQLPPGEQLPAAPFLIAAYAFALLTFSFYLWTLWRRLRAVEHDMQALARRRAPTNQGSAAR
jgi:type VI protein secretion system component VasF